MRHPATKTVFRQWQRLKIGSRPPDRRAINPADFGAHLADVFLLDRIDGDIRFRLAGSRVCGLFGEELRNLRFIRLFSHEAFDDAQDLLAAVIEDQTPVIAGISALFPDRVSADGELLLLPLGYAEGRTEDVRILGVLTTTGHRPAAQPACSALDILSIRIIGENDQISLVSGAEALELPPQIEHASIRRSRFRLYQGGLKT
jgi:hypothetical protein